MGALQNCVRLPLGDGTSMRDELYEAVETYWRIFKLNTAPGWCIS